MVQLPHQRENVVPSPTRSTALKDIWSMLGIPTEGVLRPPAKSQALQIKFSSGQAYAIVKKGVPSRTLAPLGQYLGLGKGAIAAYLDLDRATATRKVAKDEMLPTHAAESLLRILELDSLAEDTFETPEEAGAWLRRPHPMLDGESPIECAKSAFGAQRVKDILVATKYGGVV